MTPTEEIDKWIAEHGNERDALNVAISRLAQAETELEPLRAQHDAYFDIEHGERIRLVQRAEAAEIELVALRARGKESEAFATHLQVKLAEAQANLTAVDAKRFEAEIRNVRLNQSIVKMVMVMKEAVENCETCRGQVNGCARCATFGNVCRDIDAALAAPDALAGVLWAALRAEHNELGKWDDEHPITSHLRVANVYAAVEAALKG